MGVLLWVPPLFTSMPSPLPRLAVGIASETQQKLRSLAILHHRTVSGEVAAALEFWIAAHIEPEKQEKNASSQVIDVDCLEEKQY